MLELAELDADSAQLDLSVATADELELPIRPAPGEVAGPVHPFARRAAKWIGDKPLRRQIGAMQVAARHPCAADAQLADHARRNEIEMCVDNIRAGACDRTPNRNGRRHLGNTSKGGAPHRRFGGPILVDERRVRDGLCSDARRVQRDTPRPPTMTVRSVARLDAGASSRIER